MPMSERRVGEFGQSVVGETSQPNPRCSQPLGPSRQGLAEILRTEGVVRNVGVVC